MLLQWLLILDLYIYIYTFVWYICTLLCQSYLYNAEIIFYKPWRAKCFFNLKFHTFFSLFTSFEYLCYGLTSIINIYFSASLNIDVRCWFFFFENQHSFFWRSSCENVTRTNALWRMSRNYCLYMSLCGCHHKPIIPDLFRSHKWGVSGGTLIVV